MVCSSACSPKGSETGIRGGDLRCWKGTRPEPAVLGPGPFLAPHLLCDLT